MPTKEMPELLAQSGPERATGFAPCRVATCSSRIPQSAEAYAITGKPPSGLRPAKIPEDGNLPIGVIKCETRCRRDKLRCDERAGILAGLAPIIEKELADAGCSPWRSPLEAAERMSNCASWIWLREKGRNVRLHAANFCDQQTICPPCQHARSRALLRRYQPRIAPWGKDGSLYLCTLTWPSVTTRGDAWLRFNLQLGWRAWKKLWDRRKARGTGPLSRIEGAVVSSEVTWGPAGWHPHLHVIFATEKGFANRVDVDQLRRDWRKLTGGSQIRLDYLKPGEDQAKGIKEALKYSVKTEASISKRRRAAGEQAPQPMACASGSVGRLYMGAALLYKMRRVRSYGAFYAFGDEEEAPLCEEDAIDEETRDWLGRWVGWTYDFREWDVD